MATTIVLSPETEERLDFLASETGRSKDFFLQELVERVMEDIEDCYLSIEVLERIRSGEEKVYSSAEVRRNLGLDD
ncbi:MAG: CopG family transcriptional regulator [Chloroflexi bacterium]|nr:CopG family transcriptional regulator [Chloroflexota bacterium]